MVYASHPFDVIGLTDLIIHMHFQFTISNQLQVEFIYHHQFTKRLKQMLFVICSLYKVIRLSPIINSCSIQYSNIDADEVLYYVDGIS